MSDWVELGIFLLIICLLTKPIGLYHLVKVLDPKERTFLDPIFKPLERWMYRLCGIDPFVEQNWKEYIPEKLPDLQFFPFSAETRISGVDLGEKKFRKGAIDAISASASGLDPHIGLANARLQISRIVKTRGLSEDMVKDLISKYTESPTFGFIGEERINVLKINLALDDEFNKK